VGAYEQGKRSRSWAGGTQEGDPMNLRYSGEGASV